MNMHVRHRSPPDPMTAHYKTFTKRIREDAIFREKMRDRAAFVYVTGIYPSHLREEANDFLRNVVRLFPQNSALDRRSGQFVVHEDVVADLELMAHPMVRKVREKLSQGYFIQGSRGHGERRNYSKIYMFRLNADNIPFDCITIKGDAAVKEGWE